MNEKLLRMLLASLFLRCVSLEADGRRDLSEGVDECFKARGQNFMGLYVREWMAEGRERLAEVFKRIESEVHNIEIDGTIRWRRYEPPWATEREAFDES